MSDVSMLPGIYRALVTRNDDPEKKGRVIVIVPTINGEGEFDWAMPCVPFLTLNPEVMVTGSASTSAAGDPSHGHFVTMTSHGDTETITLRVPPVGAVVWIMFEQGDPEFPVYMGTFIAPVHRAA